MRQAQTEYESCVDVYQLRIKTLNKVRVTALGLMPSNITILEKLSLAPPSKPV